MKKNIILLAIIVICILLVPLSLGWNWSPSDFLSMGALLFATGLTYLLVARKAKTPSYKAAIGFAVFTALILFWVNGAVGIIGDENPANAFYMLMIPAGIIGAAIARLRPRGMSYLLFGMTVVQMIVPIVAVIFWRDNFAPGIPQVFLLNAAFAALWVTSGLCFRHSAMAAK